MTGNIEITFSLPDFIVVGREFTIEFSVLNPLDEDAEVYIRAYHDGVLVGDWSDVVDSGGENVGLFRLVPDKSPYEVFIKGEAYTLDGVLVGEGMIEISLSTSPGGFRFNFPVLVGLGGILWGGLSGR